VGESDHGLFKTRVPAETGIKTGKIMAVDSKYEFESHI
jgi:hypothetical protein